MQTFDSHCNEQAQQRNAPRPAQLAAPEQQAAFGCSEDTDKQTITFSAAPQVPVANFSGTPTSGTAPLEVSFTDLSNGEIDSWLWTFGDGGTSTDQNPTYTYYDHGIYTVSLEVTGPGGSDADTKNNYITSIVEENSPEDFFNNPKSDRAKQFLNEILAN